jgi:hypothetical protein
MSSLGRALSWVAVFAIGLASRLSVIAGMVRRKRRERAERRVSPDSESC